ncbi:tail fiber protein [Pontibacter sp. G13]|uniref:phage tail protein n=1 Tax=Pontibacter sp. G13 TaxID=3074898 RepID=UPI002889C0AC|nr:tail fiber protein [Pontibacter sp. G13]WNJ17017.1 tail fiber protein [Pontibacter sp. G13]
MEPFIGEIRLFAGNFAPRGWAFCNGSLIAVSSNTALFSILGTTYGGDGRTDFALPDLRGRVPIQQGQGAGLSYYGLGQRGGSPRAYLSVAQIPAHSHPVAQKAYDKPGTSADPSNRYLANSVGFDREYADEANTSMALNMTGNTGGSQPISLQQPYLALNFIIALVGLYPSRS